MVLVIATAVATPLMLSTTPINIGAGAVYGVMLGTFVTLVGHVAGAWICYVWSRWWARDWIARKMRSSETLPTEPRGRGRRRGGARWCAHHRV